MIVRTSYTAAEGADTTRRADRDTRIVLCRYLRRNDEYCTAEALDPDPEAEILICAKHAAKVMRLIQGATQ